MCAKYGRHIPKIHPGFSPALRILDLRRCDMRPIRLLRSLTSNYFKKRRSSAIYEACPDRSVVPRNQLATFRKTLARCLPEAPRVRIVTVVGSAR
jgi:hypothetical protein